MIYTISVIVEARKGLWAVKLYQNGHAGTV